MTSKRNISYTYLKYLLTSIILLMLIMGYAQELGHNGQTAIVDTIDVVRNYRPILADAVKIRRSPDMRINREEINLELRQIAANTYFTIHNFKHAYHNDLFIRYPNASPQNIDNYRISYIAYLAGEYPRATSILNTLEDSDSFYQASFITLGHIALETGDKQAARTAFVKAMKLDYDSTMKADALYNYAKVLYELDSVPEALNVLEKYINQKYPARTLENKKPESPEELSIEILLGTSNFHAGVSLIESLKSRDRQTNMTYQKATYFRGLEFYNERAFENSISMFMRAEKFPFDLEMAALATYWKAEAMYEVRKYKEAVENFTQFLSLPAARNTDVYSFAHYALAYAAYRNNSFGIASDYFIRFLNREGNSLADEVRYDVIARLGDSYLSLRNYHRANQYYDELIDNQAFNQDYALFQKGIIQGLQGNNDTKLITLASVVEKFPKSNYADDVAFEIPYTHFIMENYESAIQGLQSMIQRYPRSSYVPRALLTIGLVQYNKGDADAAMSSFQKVIEQYATSNEASQALRFIENIYLDRGDASGYIQYATSTNIRKLSPSEQDDFIFQTALSLFTKGQYQAAVEAVNAYFDTFPKVKQEKYARYIRGVSLYHTGHPQEALHDLNIILNDWTSKYTENTLLTAAALYMDLEQYNEAIVHLKKIELTTENKKNYSYAVTNLMRCYLEIGDLDQVAKYVQMIKNADQSSEEDLAKAHLYNAQALLKAENKAAAIKELNLATLRSNSEVAAEAKYRLAQLQYESKQYDQAQETAFDLVNNMEEHDYWVAKSFILLADTYNAKGNKTQARVTLKSIIENYEGKDDVIPSAKERLQKLNGK